MLLKLRPLPSPSSNLKILTLLLSWCFRTIRRSRVISFKLLMLQWGSRDCDSGLWPKCVTQLWWGKHSYFAWSSECCHSVGFPQIFRLLNGSCMVFWGKEIRNLLSRAWLSLNFRSVHSFSLSTLWRAALQKNKWQYYSWLSTIQCKGICVRDNIGYAKNQ